MGPGKATACGSRFDNRPLSLQSCPTTEVLQLILVLFSFVGCIDLNCGGMALQLLTHPAQMADQVLLAQDRPNWTVTSKAGRKALARWEEAPPRSAGRGRCKDQMKPVPSELDPPALGLRIHASGMRISCQSFLLTVSHKLFLFAAYRTG